MLPLSGLRVIEFGGIGPAPYATMVLADWGAKIFRIDRGMPRAGTVGGDVTSRGKISVVVDAKTPEGNAVLKKMIKTSDVLIDPYRPGVLEKLGLGPDECAAMNPRLIYARMTGFPRDNSSYKDMAGHDINYIALSGVLDMIRAKDDSGNPAAPVPPMNLLGDFAGGGIMLVLGILLAVIERQASGKGQVVATDMVSGARYISSFPLLLAHPRNKAGNWSNPPGWNLLDGGSPFYGVYRTSDNKYMSVGCLEPQFFAEFARIINPHLSTPLDPKRQTDISTWPAMRATLTEAFAKKPRDEWAKMFHKTDACCVPVLTPAEVSADEVGAKGPQPDHVPPAPHPHLSRTPANGTPSYATQAEFYVKNGSGVDNVLAAFGDELSAAEKAYLAKTNGQGAKL